jgi:septal ring factor EnvC (AmiA/AmiB activator)
VLEWARARSARTLHIVISVVFLASTLIGALMLRTQMVQNSFEASQLESSISSLTQDVQDDQAKLDQLQASLPQKASDMGMTPQHGSVSIDLNGYQEGGQQ